MWKWIEKHIPELCSGLILIVGILFGGGKALINGIPLGNRERDMVKVADGFEFLLLLAGMALAVFLVNTLLEKFFAWGEKRYGNWQKYTDPAGFPKPEDRELQKLLTSFSQKTLLIVWDVIQGCIFFSFLLVLPMALEESGTDKKSIFITLIAWLGYIVGIHFLLVLYYKKRDYTDKLIKYTEKYIGPVERERFLIQLETDLKTHMLVYSQMWILTENYIMGWGETEMAFCPVAIPREEIVGIRFRVSNKWFGRGKRSICPVIICDLYNGNAVEIFAGGRFQVDVVQELMQRFGVV